VNCRNIGADCCPGVGEESRVFVEEGFGCYEVIGVEVGFGEDESYTRQLGKNGKTSMIAFELYLTRYCP